MMMHTSAKGSDFIPNTSSEDSDEERELTNLNWLLGNHNITWPNSLNAVLDDPGSNQNKPIHKINSMDVDYSKKTSFQNYSKKSSSSDFIESKKIHQNQLIKRPTPSERYDAFLSKIKQDLEEYEKSASSYETDISEKPPFNYSHIIGMAMLENGRVTLQQICNWIETKFAFFRVRKKWNNSIRHNLSLHHCFRKIDRKREEKGKGGYWELGVDPKKCDRKRIRNRKSVQTKRNFKLDSDITHQMQSVKGILSPKNKIKESHNNSISNEDDKFNKVNGILNNEIEINYTKEQRFNGAINTNTINLKELPQNQFALNDIPLTYDSRSYPQLFQKCNEPLLSNDSNLNLQKQYELGTIIVSTTPNSSELDEDTTDNASFNCLITENYSNGNFYTVDEMSPPSDDVIVASYLTNAVLENEHLGFNTVAYTVPTDNGNNVIRNGQNVIVEHIPQILTYTTTSDMSNLSLNCDYTNIRQYANGIDEAFQYFHCIESSRNEDILDNFLDVCISDY